VFDHGEGSGCAGGARRDSRRAGTWWFRRCLPSRYRAVSLSFLSPISAATCSGLA
jgi:hypothetical protein